MKTIKSTFILLLIASLSFVSCDDEPLEGTFSDELNIENGSGGTGIGNTFFAKVDGVEFVETAIFATVIQPETTTHYISIVGVIGEDYQLGLAVPKSFDVGSHSIAESVIPGTDASANYLLPGSGIRLSTMGTLNIIEKSGGRIKGTFEFTVESPTSGESNVITEGAFDVAY